MKLTKKQWSIMRKYWRLREQDRCSFYIKSMVLEDQMNKELKLPIRLEFWESDEGGGGGIGASEIHNRIKGTNAYFRLISDWELAK